MEHKLMKKLVNKAVQDDGEGALLPPGVVEPEGPVADGEGRIGGLTGLGELGFGGLAAGVLVPETVIANFCPA